MDDTLASVGNTYNGSIDSDDEFIGKWEDIDAYSMVRVWINTPASAILTIEYASSMVQLDVLPLVADQVIAEQIFACYPGNHSSIHNIKKAKYVRIKVKNTSNEAQAINIKTKYANKVPHPFLHYTNDNIDAHVSVSLDTINVDANAVNDKETSSITVYGLKEHQDTAPESAYRAITVDDTGRLNVNATGQVVVYAVDPSSTPTILKVDNDGRLMVSTDGGGAVNGEVTVTNFPLDGESLKVTGEVTTSEATSGVTVYGLNGNNPASFNIDDDGRLLVSTELPIINQQLQTHVNQSTSSVVVYGNDGTNNKAVKVDNNGRLMLSGDITLASSISINGKTSDDLELDPPLVVSDTYTLFGDSTFTVNDTDIVISGATYSAQELILMINTAFKLYGQPNSLSTLGRNLVCEIDQGTCRFTLHVLSSVLQLFEGNNASDPYVVEAGAPIFGEGAFTPTGETENTIKSPYVCPNGAYVFKWRSNSGLSLSDIHTYEAGLYTVVPLMGDQIWHGVKVIDGKYHIYMAGTEYITTVDYAYFDRVEIARNESDLAVVIYDATGIGKYSNNYRLTALNALDLSRDQYLKISTPAGSSQSLSNFYGTTMDPSTYTNENLTISFASDNASDTLRSLLGFSAGQPTTATGFPAIIETLSKLDYSIKIKYGKDDVIATEYIIPTGTYTKVSQLLSAIETMLNQNPNMQTTIQWKTKIDSGRAYIEFRLLSIVPPVQEYNGRYMPSEHKFQGLDEGYSILVSKYPFGRHGVIRCKYDVPGCYPIIGLSNTGYPPAPFTDDNILPYSLWIQEANSNIDLESNSNITLNNTLVTLLPGSYTRAEFRAELEEAIITAGVPDESGPHVGKNIVVELNNNVFTINSTAYSSSTPQTGDYDFFGADAGIMTNGTIAANGQETLISGRNHIPNTSYYFTLRVTEANGNFSAGIKLETDVDPDNLDPGNPWHGVATAGGTYNIYCDGNEVITDPLQQEIDDVIVISRYGDSFTITISDSNDNQKLFSTTSIVRSQLRTVFYPENKLRPFFYFPTGSLLTLSDISITDINADNTVANTLQLEQGSIDLSTIYLIGGTHAGNPATLRGYGSEYWYNLTDPDGVVVTEKISRVPEIGDVMLLTTEGSELYISVIDANNNFYPAVNGNNIVIKDYYPTIALSGAVGYTSGILMTADPFYFTAAEYSQQLQLESIPELVVNIRVSDPLDVYLKINNAASESLGSTSNNLFTSTEIIEGTPIDNNIATDLDGNLKTALMIGGKTVNNNNRLPVNLDPIDSGIQVHGLGGDDVVGIYIINPQNLTFSYIQPVVCKLVGVYNTGSSLALALEKALNSGAMGVARDDTPDLFLRIVPVQWKCYISDMRINIEYRIPKDDKVDTENNLLVATGGTYHDGYLVIDSSIAVLSSYTPISKSCGVVQCIYRGTALPQIGFGLTPFSQFHDLVYSIEIRDTGSHLYYAKYPGSTDAALTYNGIPVVAATGDNCGIFVIEGRIHIVMSREEFLIDIDAGIYNYDNYYPVIYATGNDDEYIEASARLDLFEYGSKKDGIFIHFDESAELATLLGFAPIKTLATSHTIAPYKLKGKPPLTSLNINRRGYVGSNIYHGDALVSSYNRLPVTVDDAVFVGIDASGNSLPLAVNNKGILTMSAIKGKYDIPTDMELSIGINQNIMYTLNDVEYLCPLLPGVYSVSTLPIEISRAMNTQLSYFVAPLKGLRWYCETTSQYISPLELEINTYIMLFRLVTLAALDVKNVPSDAPGTWDQEMKTYTALQDNTSFIIDTPFTNGVGGIIVNVPTEGTFSVGLLIGNDVWAIKVSCTVGDSYQLSDTTGIVGTYALFPTDTHFGLILSEGNLQGYGIRDGSPFTFGSIPYNHSYEYCPAFEISKANQTMVFSECHVTAQNEIIDVGVDRVVLKLTLDSAKFMSDTIGFGTNDIIVNGADNVTFTASKIVSRERYLNMDDSGNIYSNIVGTVNTAIYGSTTDDMTLDDLVLEPFSIDVMSTDGNNLTTTWYCDVSGTYTLASDMLADLELKLNQSISSVPSTLSIPTATQFRCYLKDKRIHIEYRSSRSIITDNTVNVINGLMAVDGLYFYKLSGEKGYNSAVSGVHPFTKGSGSISCRVEVSSLPCIGLSREPTIIDPSKMVYALWVEENDIGEYYLHGTNMTAPPVQVTGRVELILILTSGQLHYIGTDGNSTLSFSAVDYINNGEAWTLYPIVGLAGVTGVAQFSFTCDPYQAKEMNARSHLLTYNFDGTSVGNSLGLIGNPSVYELLVGHYPLDGTPINRKIAIDKEGNLNTNLLVNSSNVSENNPIPVGGVTGTGKTLALSVDETGILTTLPVKGRYAGDVVDITTTINSDHYIVYSIDDEPIFCRLANGEYSLSDLSREIAKAMNSGLFYDLHPGIQWECFTIGTSNFRKSEILVANRTAFPLLSPDLSGGTWDQSTKTFDPNGVNNAMTINVRFTSGAGAISIVDNGIGVRGVELVNYTDPVLMSIYVDGNNKYMTFLNGVGQQIHNDAQLADIFGIRRSGGQLQCFYNRGGNITVLGDYTTTTDDLFPIVRADNAISLHECHLNIWHNLFEEDSDARSFSLILSDASMSYIVTETLNFGNADMTLSSATGGIFTSAETLFSRDRDLNVDDSGNIILDHRTSSVQLYGINPEDGLSYPLIVNQSGTIGVIGYGQTLAGDGDETFNHPLVIDSSGHLIVNMLSDGTTISSEHPLPVSLPDTTIVKIFGDNDGSSQAVTVDASGNIGANMNLTGVPVSVMNPVPVEAVGTNVIYGRDADDAETVIRVDSSGTLNTRLLLANTPISALNPLPSQLYGTDGTDVQPIKVSTDGYINSILSGTDPSGEIIPIKVNRRGTMLTVFEKETLGELYPIMQGGAYQGLTAFKYSSIDEVIFRPSVADGLVGPELPNNIQLEKTTSSEAFISSVSHLQYSTVGQRYVCRVNCNIVPGTTNSNTFVGFGHEEDGIYMGYRRVNAPAIPCIMHKRRGAQCVVAFRLNLSSGGFVNRDGTTIWANNLFTHGGSAPTNTFYLSVTISNITYIKSLSTTNPSVDFITQSLLDTGWTYLDGSPGSPHDDWYIETREGINSITIIFTAKKAENRGSLGQLSNVSIKYHRNNASGLLFDNYDVYMLRGDSPTFNYILSSEWNVDKLDGSGPSSHIYDPDSPKNFQFIMGSQTITCQMLIGDEYATVHIIEDLGTPPFNNPLIAFHAFTNNDGIINVIDYACFAEGPPLPRPTSVVSHFGINNAGIDATSFRNIITVRNNYAIISRDYLTGRVNRSPIVINSVTGFSNSPFIRIALIKNVEMNRTISGTILRDTYKSLEQGHDKEFLSSGTSKDYDNRYGETVASSLFYPSTFLLPDTIWSAVVPVNQAFEYKFNDNEIMLYPGEWISLVAIASGSGTPTIYGTINTSELA